MRQSEDAPHRIDMQAEQNTDQAEQVATWMHMGKILRRRAQAELDDEPRQPLAGHELRRCIGRTRAAMGVDLMPGQMLKDLPIDTWDGLAEECNHWEQTLALPLQAVISIMTVLPKPQGGERLIALMHRLLRAYFKARRWHIDVWEQAKGEWWDTAIKGSSALQAAISRAFGAEMAVLAGASVVAGFIDIEKFYDSLDPHTLVVQLIRLGFPAVSLLLHLQAHWGLRCIMKGGVISPLFGVTRSILAGCTSSNAIARAYLHHVCEELTWQIPSVKLNTFVGDFVLWLIGSKVTLATEMTNALGKAYDVIKKAGLTISEKSVVVSSNKQLAVETSQRVLTEKGIHSKAAGQTKDLGVATSLARSRVATVMANRFEKAKLKSKKVQVIKHALKSSGIRFATKAWSTAIAPTMLYGNTAAGIGKAALHSVRTEAVRTLGLEMAGHSTTAVLAVALGELADPAVKVPVATIMQWLQIARSQFEHYPGLPSMWRLAVKAAKSRRERRWQAVKGPMTATISTLLDCGWEPEEWNQWLDPNGHLWSLADADDKVINVKTCDAMLRVLRQDVLRQKWATSSISHMFNQEAPWTEGLRKLWLRLGRTQKYDQAKMLIRVVSGGLWTSERVAQAESKRRASLVPAGAGGSAESVPAVAGGCATTTSHCKDDDKCSPHCRLCGAPVQSEWHTAWECPAVLKAESMRGCEELVKRANTPKNSHGFWLRALSTNIYHNISPPTMQDCVEVWPADWWEPGSFYTDASGGEHNEDPLLRRVGIAACSLKSMFTAGGAFEPEVEAHLMGPLPGPTQTINRGELYAIVQLLKRILHRPGKTTTVYTDSQYCVGGYMQGAIKQLATFNDDLWEAFFAEVARLNRQVVLIKVKSHLEIQDAANGLILLQDLTGNAIADSLAKKAAAKAAITTKEAEGVGIAKGTVIKVAMHLIKANLEYLQQLEAAGHRDPNKKRCAPAGASRKRTPAHRGHEVRRIGTSRWRCHKCLAIRTSLAAHRWPKQCSQVIHRLPGRHYSAASINSAQAQATSWQSSAGAGGSPLAAANALDEAAAADPFQDLHHFLSDEQELLPPEEEELQEYLAENQAVEPFEVEEHTVIEEQLPPEESMAVDEAEMQQPALPSPPALAVAEGSWWQRVGATLASSDLVIGGAPVHFTHTLACFGNEEHSLVLCTLCGGMTQGTFAPLLADVCRKRANATRQRQLQRVLGRQLWPTGGLQQQYGRGSISAVIRFVPTPTGAVQIRAASGAGVNS